MNGNSRRGRRLAAWIAAAGCAFWMLAQAVPADAQASRTRPGGGGSSSSSSSGGGGSSASSGSGGSSSSSGGPTSVTRTRPSPPSSSGSQTVIQNRRPPSRGHGGHDHRGGYYYGSWGWPYYGWWGWSSWYPWGWPGYPYYPGYPGYHPPAVYAGEPGTGYGALDTDVWPARTQVWIDGQYVGFVDQFDGFPRYLWLEAGTYDVVFYHEGFRTLARQYTVYPGLVIDVEDRLDRGEAIHPNDLAPKETPRRDARIEADRERQAAAEEPEWRARLRAEREAAAVEAEAPAPGVRAGDARLFLRVTPSDAAVYLDGRFLGTARELTDRDTGISVTPGRHELSVVRPGYEPEWLEFEAEAAGNVDLGVDLEAAG